MDEYAEALSGTGAFASSVLAAAKLESNRRSTTFRMTF